MVLLKTLFSGTSDYLKLIKSKDTPVSAVINDLKGNFIMGAKVSYNKNDDEENPDNWNLIWTFDEKDVEDSTKYSLTEIQPLSILNQRSNQDFCGCINDISMEVQTYSLLAKCLKNHMEQNAVDENPYKLVLDGYFEMYSSKEGNTIEIAIEPHGNMSKIIKDDSAVEVTE